MKKWWAVLTLAAAACGGGSGGSGGGGGTTGATPVLSVGGTYSTAVTLSEDTCGGTAVQSLPTTVTHTAGAAALSVVHGGTTWPGTVSADGSFRTDAVSVGAADGSTHTLGITGRFSTSGFEATVTSNVRRASASDCRYVVRWVGTKQGSPNVIP